MGSHPINLAIRFLLEITALIAMGFWGWRQSEGWFRYILALIIPILAAVVWGTFAVPNDPSRSGSAPIPVPGLIRLVIELAIFLFAFWSLNNLELKVLSWVFGIIVIVHYITSYDRILWLITQ